MSLYKNEETLKVIFLECDCVCERKSNVVNEPLRERERERERVCKRIKGGKVIEMLKRNILFIFPFEMMRNDHRLLKPRLDNNLVSLNRM